MKRGKRKVRKNEKGRKQVEKGGWKEAVMEKRKEGKRKREKSVKKK